MNYITFCYLAEVVKQTDRSIVLGVLLTATGKTSAFFQSEVDSSLMNMSLMIRVTGSEKICALFLVIQEGSSSEMVDFKV